MTAKITSFIAFATRAEDLALLKQFAAARGLNEEDIHQGDIEDATRYLADRPAPDVLLVEIDGQDKAKSQLDALAEVCDAATHVITIGRINEYSFYCWLMEIGITQYLLSPLSEVSLAGAFDKLQGVLSGKPAASSVLIAVTGARGGVGATTIAVQLAGLLAENTHKRVALVDLDPQEGSVALTLDIQPSHGLREALEKPDRIDGLFFERVMSRVGKYLSVLSAEERLSEALMVHPDAADPLLAELRDKYDYVVLDVPRHLNHVTRASLQQADHFLLVTELSLLCLRDTLRLQEAMREDMKAKPPLMVANRVGMMPKVQVPQADFEQGVGAKISVAIPFAPELLVPFSKDIAVVKNRTHPAAKRLQDLAALIMPDTQVAAVEKQAPKSLLGLFGKKG